MLLWFHLVIPSFPARIDDMRSRFSALSNGALQKVIADMKTAAQERKSYFYYFKSANLSKSLLKLTM